MARRRYGEALLEEIKLESKQLSREDRERFLAYMASGLDDAPLSEIDQARIAEAERRGDDLVSGRVKGIPVKEVFDGVRRELGRKK